MTDYGTTFVSEWYLENLLLEDNPSQEVLILRKKLLRYTKPLSDTDRIKYNRDLFYIQLKEDKMKGRDKRAGK